MTTNKNIVQKKFAAIAMLVAPLALGGVFALALGFTAPMTANADGVEWGYTDVYAPSSGGSSDWGYTDVGYYDDGGSDWGYTDVGYYDDGPTDWGYTDVGYYDEPYYTDYEPARYTDFEPAYYTDYAPASYTDYEPYYPSYSYPTYNYSSQPYSYDYDYSYDSYSYDYYEYEYEEIERDYCSSRPGIQDRDDDCDRDHDDDDLDCELTADDRTVEEGDEVTLEWDIEGDADYASINHGVGRVDEDGGEEDVEVDEDTTFRLTVRDGNDEATCSVTVRVDEDDNTFSSIDFEGEPANNPPQVVYLSSIPYTGLEDITPAMLSYWLMLIAGAGMLGWFLVKNGFVPSFAFASAQATEEAPAPEAADEAPTATENAFVSALTDGDVDRAIDGLRDGAVQGTSIEDALEEAAKAAEGTPLESRINAALEASRVNGIRGVKAVLA